MRQDGLRANGECHLFLIDHSKVTPSTGAPMAFRGTRMKAAGTVSSFRVAQTFRRDHV
jgi:hypothetical protein